MTTSTTHLFFIIDKSGSMQPRVSQVYSGFKEFIEEQKTIGGSDSVSVVFFNTGSDLVLDKVPLADVVELEPGTYRPSGCTALYDAMGKVLSRLKEGHAEGEEAILIVITDGEENSSFEFSQQNIRELISETKEFVKTVFLGSNQDAVLNGANLGIDVSLDYVDNNLQTAMRGTSAAVNRYRSAGGTESITFTQTEREVSMGTENTEPYH